MGKKVQKPFKTLNPKIIDYSRRKRIASGSGSQVEEVNKLIKQLPSDSLVSISYGYRCYHCTLFAFFVGSNIKRHCKNFQSA